MNATVTSLAARRRSATVEDALASIHAGAISEHLAAALGGNAAAMKAVRSRAHALDIAHPGGPSLVDQLDALRTQTAA